MKQELIDLGYSEEQATKIINKERIYFQADVDNIADKVRDTENKKYNELLNQTNKMKIENEFINNGGNKEAFNDFYNSTQGYDFNNPNSFEELKKSKPYFFTKHSLMNSANIDLEKERESLAQDNNLIPGTIYRRRI